MLVETALAVLASHWAGDFAAQSDVMSTRKSSSFYWLTAHVATYTAVLGVGVAYLSPTLGVEDWWRWLAINCIIHWLVDAVTSRVTAYLWGRGERHWFFVTVGLDQLIHQATLLWTLDYIAHGRV